jgi:hypothetical protein
VEYDLGRQKLAFVDTPITGIVMPWEGGRLGFAAVRWQSSTLHLWSRDARPDGTAAWMERRVFDLKAVPTLDVVGFAEGLGVDASAVTLRVVFRSRSRSRPRHARASKQRSQVGVVAHC